MRSTLFFVVIPFLMLAPPLGYTASRLVESDDWRDEAKKRAGLFIVAFAALAVSLILTYFWGMMGLEGTPLDNLIGLIDTLQYATKVPILALLISTPVMLAALLLERRRPRVWEWFAVFLPIAMYLLIHTTCGFCTGDMGGRFIDFVCGQTALSTANSVIGGAMAAGLVAGSFDRRSHWMGIGFACITALVVALYNYGARA